MDNDGMGSLGMGMVWESGQHRAVMGHNNGMWDVDVVNRRAHWQDMAGTNMVA